MKLKDFRNKEIMLDTNIIIFQLNGKIDLADELALAKLRGISVITQSELYAGVEQSDILFLQEYLENFSIIPLSSEIATLAGAYKSLFPNRGLKDLLIAATAEVNKLTLLTNNYKDFEGLVSKIYKITVS